MIDAGSIRRRLERPLPGKGRRRLFIIRHRVLRAIGHAAQRCLDVVEHRTDRRRVACPACGWEGLWFRPVVGPAYIAWNARCGGCSAKARHRAVALFWPTIQRQAGTGLCLSVAPERCLRPLIEGQGRSVISTDIAMARISMRSDVEALPVRAGAFGLIVCSDVLEHVVDDERALREITRVLAPDGIAVLHVPVVATETVEFGRAVDQDFGHRRTYGPDVIDRLRRAELAVETLDTRSLPKAQFKRAGLKPDVVYVASRSERSPSRLAVVDVLATR